MLNGFIKVSVHIGVTEYTALVLQVVTCCGLHLVGKVRNPLSGGSAPKPTGGLGVSGCTIKPVSGVFLLA